MLRSGPFADYWLRCRRAAATVALAFLATAISVPAAPAPQAGAQSQQRPAATTTPASGGNAAEGAPVLLDGKQVLRVRWGYKTFTPASRAANISSKLKHVADNLAAARLSVQPEDATTDVMSGETLIAAVFDGDAKAAGASKEEVAQQWASAMQQAVDGYRSEHSLRLKLTRIVLALLTILICVAVLAIVRELTRNLTQRATTTLREGAARADQRLAFFLAHEQTHNLVSRTFTVTRMIVSLAILWVSLHLLLSIWPSTRPLSERMSESVLRPIRAFGAAFLASLPSLIVVVLILVVTWYAIRLVHFFFSRIRQREITLEGFRPAWAPATDRLVTITLVILALLVAYPYIPGSESPAFKGISIFLGVLVSLGSTGLVGNAVTGVSLTYVDAFDIGDLVKIGEVVGWVTKMGMLTTRVRTRKNEIITIPNSFVVSKEITNFNKPGDHGVIITSKVGIGYDAPWRQVEGMLKLAARRTPGIRPAPEPFVLELSLNAFDITYELNAYLEAGQLLHVVLAELNRNILDAFNEYGVQIMTPAYVADPQRDKVVPPDQWNQPPATSADVPDTSSGESKAAD
jgi:small-conductance mechanosensitive channel